MSLRFSNFQLRLYQWPSTLSSSKPRQYILWATTCSN